MSDKTKNQVAILQANRRRRAVLDALLRMGSMATSEAISVMSGLPVSTVSPILYGANTVEAFKYLGKKANVWAFKDSKVHAILSGNYEVFSKSCDKLKKENFTLHELVRKQNKQIALLEQKTRNAELMRGLYEDKAKGADIDRFYRTKAWGEMQAQACQAERNEEHQRAVDLLAEAQAGQTA